MVAPLLLLICLWFLCVQSSIDGDLLHRKLDGHISMADSKGIHSSRRYLTVYHIGTMWSEDSPDVYENNLKLFVSAMVSDNQGADHSSFYIFHVVDLERNSLARFLSPTTEYSMIINGATGMSDIQSHIHVISKIGASLMSKFATALFLNYETRGPFKDRKSGSWWNSFSNVLQTHPSVGIVGSTINCDMHAYVQTHAFAMPGKLAHRVFDILQRDKHHTKRKQLEVSVTTETRKLGYTIASLLYQKRLNETVFADDCLSSQGNGAFLANPSTWCNLRPEEVLFAKWGGMPMRNRDYYCQDSVDSVLQATMKIAESESLKLALPETILGGKLHSLHREYDQEVWRDRSVQRITTAEQLKVATGESPKKVCFLVRTAIMHGKAANAGSTAVNMDLDLFVTSKCQQALYEPVYTVHFTYIFFVNSLFNILLVMNINANITQLIHVNYAPLLY